MEPWEFRIPVGNSYLCKDAGTKAFHTVFRWQIYPRQVRFTSWYIIVFRKSNDPKGDSGILLPDAVVAFQKVLTRTLALTLTLFLTLFNDLEIIEFCRTLTLSRFAWMRFVQSQQHLESFSPQLTVIFQGKADEPFCQALKKTIMEKINFISFHTWWKVTKGKTWWRF